MGQQGYQLVFNLRQMHVLVIYLNKTALKVNEQAAYFVFGVFIRSALAVAEGSADAGQEFRGSKWLGKVIVSAHIQGSYLAAFHGPGGDYYDGHGTVGPYLLYDFQSVHVGKTQVQQDHIRFVGVDQFQAVRTRVCTGYLVVLRGQDCFYKIADILFVLNDDNTGSCVHKLIFPPIW